MGSITHDSGIYFCLAFQWHSLTDASVGLITPTQRQLPRCHCKQRITILHVSGLKLKDGVKVEWSLCSIMKRLLVRTVRLKEELLGGSVRSSSSSTIIHTLKGCVTQKYNLCPYLLILLLFQTWNNKTFTSMVSFPWKAKGEQFKNHKGIVHPKIEIISWITHPHVVPNL